jgi:hypothetical protein
VDREEQLTWERKWAPFAAGAAFLSALLSLAAFLYQRSITPVPQNVAQFLVSLDEKSGKYLFDTILSALSAMLLAPILYYLYRATKARRPIVPKLALFLAIIAPIGYGAVVVATAVNQASIAHDFVRAGKADGVVVGKKADKTVDDRKGSANDNAKKAVASSGALAGVSIAVTLGLAIAFVLICLNAMRAGLLSRFTGSLGMVIGALYVFQFLIPPGLVQLFWLPAIGLLFLNRWPQGRGPAWDAGEAQPWPTAQDRRDAIAGVEPSERPQRPARGGGLAGLFRPQAPSGEPDAAADESDDDEVTHTGEPVRPRESTHPRSKKKRKRR